LEHSKKDFSSYTPLQMRETTEANETYFTKWIYTLNRMVPWAI
jgi:hypothetical protein